MCKQAHKCMILTNIIQQYNNFFVMLNINAAYSLVQTSLKWNVSDKHLSKHASVNVTSFTAITEYL